MISLAVATFLVLLSSNTEHRCHDGSTKCVSQKVSSPSKERVNTFNIRTGASSGNSPGKLVLCAEGSPWYWLSIEACGTGANLWTLGEGHEISHYRIKFTPYQRAFNDGILRIQAGFGFAELQIGEDAIGFDFNGTGPNNTETAGFETSLSSQWLMALKTPFDLILDGNIGYAYFRHARRLLDPQPVNHLFASATLGVGW